MPGSGSRRIRRTRWDTTYCCRGVAWQIHPLWAGQIGCRLLEKYGKSDRDNVRCLTGVGGMAAVSRGWGWFHVKQGENCLKPALVHRVPGLRDACQHAVCCARAIAGLPASSPGETPATSRQCEYRRSCYSQRCRISDLSARRCYCAEHRRSIWRTAAGRWAPPTKPSMHTSTRLGRGGFT